LCFADAVPTRQPRAQVPESACPVGEEPAQTRRGSLARVASAMRFGTLFVLIGRALSAPLLIFSAGHFGCSDRLRLRVAFSPHPYSQPTLKGGISPQLSVRDHQ